MTRTLPFFLAVLLAAGLDAVQAEEPICPDPLPQPYVFLLMDTSGSMNYSPPCSQTQLDNGECSFLCPTGDCFVPLQGDDPASKFHQMKEGLHTVLAGQSGVHFGFASFNQDELNVRSKHWIYEAQGDGPLLLGGVARYPVAGAREVFGYLWPCDTGSLDNEIGCTASKPADLVDSWELTRVRRLPKAGLNFTQSQAFYIRQAPITYKVTYSPPVATPPGSATIQTNIRVDRCGNPTCSSVTLMGQQAVTWSKVAELISWDNAFSGNTVRTNPLLDYFGQYAAADADASNTCSGWDPNTDSTADRSSGYSLRWPTVTDSRGPLLHRGDVIPLDWQQDNSADIQARLAPNLQGFPGTPDFRIAPYLRDTRLGSDPYLRLKDETRRPLIAVGSTPLAQSLQSFRVWYTGCAQGFCVGGGWSGLAEANDPDWMCKKKVVVLLTDGEDTCGSNPCAVAGVLGAYGVEVQVVGFGADPASSQLQCVGTYGGASFPETRQELIDALNAVIDAAKVP